MVGDVGQGEPVVHGAASCLPGGPGPRPPPAAGISGPRHGRTGQPPRSAAKQIGQRVRDGRRFKARSRR
jgi:hypothetical protein